MYSQLSEFKALSQKQSSRSLLVQEEVFKMMDINKDGIVSQAEVSLCWKCTLRRSLDSHCLLHQF